jgi:hypothetical protein
LVSLVRSGPKILLIESEEIHEFKKSLTESLGAKEYSFNSAFENAGEDSTILFLIEKMKEVVEEHDILGTLIVPEEPDVFLCKLINNKKNLPFGKVRTSPRIIMLRAFSEIDKVIEEIHADHGGHFGSSMEILNSKNEQGTLVAVTDKPLHHNIGINDLYPKCLFIDQSFYPLFKNLRLHALKYLNKGISNKDWNEIEIRIYDRYSEYKLHYQRLSDILDFLELGIILGESWTKDYPRFMMAVGVYRIRFFTFHDPKYIKKILVGLEHLEDGTRIVDYDIYYKHKKLGWADSLEKDDPRVRHLLGIKYREKIFKLLSPQEAEKIIQQEAEIIHTRI